MGGGVRHRHAWEVKIGPGRRLLGQNKQGPLGEPTIQGWIFCSSEQSLPRTILRSSRESSSSQWVQRVITGLERMDRPRTRRSEAKMEPNWLYARYRHYRLYLSWGIPTTTLRFSDSPKGLKELRIAVFLTVTIHSSKRIQIKMSKDKRHTRQSQGETRREPLIALSCWNCTDHGKLPHNNVWQHVVYCHLGKSPEAQSPEFSLVVIHVGMECQ